MKTPLTKSFFMRGLPCKEKLKFTLEKSEIKNDENSFLKALAQGGFQVEELARMHYPDGIFIDTKPDQYEKAAKLTTEALENENVVLFEAAFLVDGYFVRTDILEKRGNKIKIIEVKSKAFSPDDKFLTSAGTINAKWEDNLWDLAFQSWVIQKVLPRGDYDIEAVFLFVDKTKKASIDGMNQLFRVPANGSPRSGIIRRVEQLKDLGESILIEVKVPDEIFEDIHVGNHYHSIDGAMMWAQARDLRDYVKGKDEWPTPEPTFKKCKSCEFRTELAEDGKEILSKCFASALKVPKLQPESILKLPTIFDIWDYRSGPLGRLQRDNLFLEDLTAEDLNVCIEPDKISRSDRQWLQVRKAVKKDNSIYCETQGLNNEMKKWQYPLHFIDFETSGSALPFMKNLSPYEQVAFQFSHHMVLEDGSIEHQTEFISNTPGEFPNFIFARALYSALKNDNGTIFRFHNHENTTLNVIIKQLQDSNEPDAEELISFLKTITISTKNSASEWKGERAMVDLHKVVKDYYYNPFTEGSNSIKDLLPACLTSSSLLKNKYSQPLGNLKLTSKNFDSNHIWLKLEGEKAENPYKMLPPLFENWESVEMKDTISEMGSLADGGAALTAYAKLQYQDMSDNEREEITKGLLKYCELDTLAMVMIYEHLQEIIKTES
jgi:hypothetical protein